MPPHHSLALVQRPGVPKPLVPDYDRAQFLGPGSYLGRVQEDERKLELGPAPLGIRVDLLHQPGQLLQGRVHPGGWGGEGVKG